MRAGVWDVLGDRDFLFFFFIILVGGRRCEMLFSYGGTGGPCTGCGVPLDTRGYPISWLESGIDKSSSFAS